MATIDPKNVSTAVFHSYLLSAVAPRPIAFASTVDAAGNVNISPFSFFNTFSANPPILVFSPARRVRDNTTKHTLENVLEVPEVVINVVNYSIVHQASLASTEYAKGVNEFEKAGLTQVPSVLVKPPRVKESPVSFECKVTQVISLGENGGAGNMIICEVLLVHIDDSVLDANGKIDQHKIDLVARLGGDWYSRTSGDALFEIEKPVKNMGIGVDALPAGIRGSSLLTGGHKAQLGNVEAIPSPEDGQKTALPASATEEDKHRMAAGLLDKGEVAKAWQVLLG